MTLIKSGKFVDIRADTKAVFKISQKSISNTKIKRVLVCKTKGCSKKGEIILYGKSENYCELWLNKYPHEETCENQSDLFKHPNLRILLGTSLKPTEIIKKFNQGSERKLIDNDETRKKISKLKYTEKVKIDGNQEITNLKSLQSWLHTRHQENTKNESFEVLNWNEPFVADYKIYGENFYAFLTTKNLVYNFVKQEQTDFNRLCADGTYKANNLGYPLIVLGTIDLHRKFHHSKIISLKLLKIYSWIWIMQY